MSPDLDPPAPESTPQVRPASVRTPQRSRVTVVTRLCVAATPAEVWDSLMFYEAVEGTPPLLMRLLLPRPLRTQGSKSAVGDRATCLYQGGHLLKQVTRIEPRQRYEFSVVEQQLAIGRSIRLCGGSYTLREIPPGWVELSITTSYSSGNRPHALAGPVESAVCHLFHRYLLGAIRRKAEAHGGATVIPGGASTRRSSARRWTGAHAREN